MFNIVYTFYVYFIGQGELNCIVLRDFENTTSGIPIGARNMQSAGNSYITVSVLVTEPQQYHLFYKNKSIFCRIDKIAKNISKYNCTYKYHAVKHRIKYY